MKTIQECFKEANADEIVNDFLFAHPLTFKPSDDIALEKTVAQVYQEYKDAVYGLIEDIRNIEITPDENGESWIFFVHHCIEDCGDDVCVTLSKRSDIKNTDKLAESYSYIFSPLAETAGFYVADTYLTQRHISTVLCDYLYESSFFGFKQERLADAVEELDGAVDEADEFDEDADKGHSLEDVCEQIGWTPEVRDPVEKSAWKDLIAAEIAYSEVARRVEEEKVLETLENE